MISRVLIDRELNKTEKLLLVYLIDKMDVSNSITIPIKDIAFDLQMAKPTVVTAISGLVEKGRVQKENNFFNGIIITNTYKINISKYM